MIASVITRLGVIIRALVSLGLETLAIGTEAAKIGAEHLDAFLDDLNAGNSLASQAPDGPVTARIGEVARMLASVSIEALALFTETLKTLTVHLDGFLDDLNQRMGTPRPPA